MSKLMLNTSPCHSEERSDEESLQGGAIFTCIGSNVLNVSGILRSAHAEGG